jgi:hypothetical protein
MSKFALNKDFDSIKRGVKDSKKTLELTQFGEEYILLGHIGDSVEELVSLTKDEWRAVWQMLTDR